MRTRPDYRIHEVAAILGVSCKTVTRRWDDGKLGGTRSEVQRQRRISGESLREYLREYGDAQQCNRYMQARPR